jgi:general secretion pathway protein E/type IV pilus assembly protein PilB
LPVYRGSGCRSCRQSTFRGRTGIHELLVTTDSIRELIVNRANASHIRHEALRQGMTTLRRDGWRKVLNGTTAMDEVARVTAGDIIG